MKYLVKAPLRLSATNMPPSMVSNFTRSIPYAAPQVASSAQHVVMNKSFTTPPPRPVKTPRAPRTVKLNTVPPAPGRLKTVDPKPVPRPIIDNLFRQAEKQPSSVATPANSSCRLLSLPGELRNRIYSFALVGTKNIEIDAARWSTHQPALLKTCKQIRSEALPLLYVNNKISTNIHDWNPILKKRFAQLMNTHDVKPKHLHHYFSGVPNWENLMKWLEQVYEGHVGAISDVVGKPRPMERKIIGVMFKVVRMEMARKAAGESSSWQEIEVLLTAHRDLLAFHDDRWLV